MKIETDTKQGGTSMRRWGSIRMLLSLLAAIALAALLAGCPDDDDDDDEFTVNLEGTDLTAANAASIGGLTFSFAAADGEIFGFAGEACTVELGDDGTTFTLVCDGTTVNGAVTFGSCTGTPDQTNDDFGESRTYETCETDVVADGTVTGGSSFQAATTLLLAENVGDTPVESAPLDVEYEIDNDGTVSRNNADVGQAEMVTGVTGGASN